VRVGTIIGFQNPPRWRTDWPALYAQGLDFAVAAERAGLDEVWLTEHHFAEDGYCPALMPVAAAIAARTTRIRIGTKVLLMPFHNPLRLAEDAAVVDLISGGRLDVGIAAGYRHEEFAGFGVDRSERAARTREGIEILENALSGEPFSYQGRFQSFDAVQVTPPPVQRPVPIWVGGRSDKSLQRAAAAGHHLQLADFDPELCAADVATYAAALEEAGRDLADHEVAAVASLLVDEDGDRARRAAAPHLHYQQDQYQRWFAAAGDRTTDMPAASAADRPLPPGCLAGTPEQVLAAIAAMYERVPFTHFSFWTLLPGLDPAIARRSLELFAERVMPELKALPPR
jgi:alkanesulfonate monooxygenase SsuD/methylene tetrahydromethanopterin reductase-like flavin-dependent oxidoreductase (luciferase family)